MTTRSPLQIAIHDLRNELTLINMDVHQLRSCRDDDAAFEETAESLRQHVKSMAALLEKTSKLRAEVEQS